MRQWQRAGGRATLLNESRMKGADHSCNHIVGDATTYNSHRLDADRLGIETRVAATADTALMMTGYTRACIEKTALRLFSSLRKENGLI